MNHTYTEYYVNERIYNILYEHNDKLKNTLRYGYCPKIILYPNISEG